MTCAAFRWTESLSKADGALSCCIKTCESCSHAYPTKELRSGKQLGKKRLSLTWRAEYALVRSGDSRWLRAVLSGNCICSFIRDLKSRERPTSDATICELHLPDPSNGDGRYRHGVGARVDSPRGTASFHARHTGDECIFMETFTRRQVS